MKRRTGDSAARQRSLRISRVEGRRIVHVQERRLGNAEACQQLLAHALHGGQRAHRRESTGNHPRHAPVDTERELGCVRRPAEGVECVPERQRGGVDDVEGLPIETVEVSNVIDCLGHEVDWDEVERSALGPDERHPLREGVAHLLDELEGVVRPVDPIRLAVVGRPDDHARAVDPPGNGRVGPYDALRLVFGLVVGMVELLALVEHRLGERALEAAGHGDGADQVDARGVDFVGEPDEVARAHDVGALGLIGIGRQVVDGGEVEDMRPTELFAIVDRQRESRLGEVAGQGVESLAPGSKRSRWAAKRAREPWRTSTKTLSPLARSSGTRWRPMKPVAPVMKYVTRPTIAFWDNRRQSHA